MNNLYKLASISIFTIFFSCNSNQKRENFGYPKEDEIDILHQEIELEVDWEQKQLKGNTIIDLKTLSKTDSISLEAADLTIQSATIGDNTQVGFKLNEEMKSLVIRLDKAYSPNETLRLTLKYETNHQNQSDPNNIWGSFGRGLRFFEPTSTEKERRKQVWAVGEPELNKYWFPSNDDSQDLRTSELTIKVEKPLTAISGGVLKSKEDSNDETKIFRWKNTIPHSNQQLFLVIGEYHNFKQNYREIVINNYGYPDEMEGTEASVVSLPEIMTFYSEYTGLKYPYPNYSQIFVQDFAGWKGGMMSSVITENMVDDKTTHEDFLYLWDVVEGEALAYQWFGNHIKPKKWQDIWLSKAFTRHLSGLYNQKANGKDEYLLYQHSPDLGTYLSDWNSGTLTIVSPDTIENMEDFVNGNDPYTKGALVLNLLKKSLGEEKWNKVIQTYVSNFGNSLVETKDFIHTVNEVHGKKMDWFFEQWVFGVGHPKFKITKHYNENEKQFTISVLQTQKVDSVVHGKQIPFFQGNIQVEIDGHVEELFIKPEKENTFSFRKEKEPLLVNFDFEDTWIKEIDFPKSDDELLAELRTSTDVLHRVTIMQKLSSVAIDSLTPLNTRNEIKKSLREIVLGDSYWRTRLMALWQLQSISSASMTNGKIELDKETKEMLLTVVERDKSWMKANAINSLGLSKDSQFVPTYMEALKDYSDRVVFMAAIALGRSKDSRAFDALINLPKKPSWKNQSLISALYGLKELADPRGYDLAINSLVASNNPHWNLATPIWDHRLAAAHTLVALDSVLEPYNLVKRQFDDALKQENVNDIFYNTLLISILKDVRGDMIFNSLKEKFKDDSNALKAVRQLEGQFKN